MAKLNNADTNDKSVYLAEIKSIMAQKDERINKLYECLVNGTAGLEENVPIATKLSIINNIEFLIARLRFVISEELRFLEYQLTLSDDEKFLQTLFSKRKSYLSAIYGKINDMRSDLELIEKTSYYNRYNN